MLFGSRGCCHEICADDRPHFLSEVVSCPEILTEEPHLPIRVIFEQALAILICESHADGDGSFACNGSDLARHRASLFESCYCAVKCDQVRRVSCVQFSVTVHVLKTFCLLHLLDYVLI